MNAFDILALGFTSIGCFLVGHYAGSGKTPKEIIKEIQLELKKEQIEVGPVNRPTPEKVNYIKNVTQKEQDEAFMESFKKEHPEVVKLYEQQTSKEA